MRVFGLIGFPLTHSFSKKYFTEKFERDKIADCRYELFTLESISELPALLKSEPALVGLNVTIPYKQQVLPFLDDRSSLPPGLNACNCIAINNGKLTGYNTDVIGFEKSFMPFVQSHHRKALVLGNGGATAAVIYVLQQAGIEYDIVSRELHGASTLTYDQLTENIIRQHPIIINSSPVGTYPKVDECPAIPYQYITSQHYLYDLVYNPTPTLFLKNGALQGATIKNGEDMLSIQAEKSWSIWNNAGVGAGSEL